MKRFLALDVFRGMTICLMIIVNTSGDWQFTFSPLKHANWHGFTPTDLVFPSFLFAVGNAFAFVKTRWADKPLSAVIGKILKRTLIIFLLGYTLYWIPFVQWNDAGGLSFIPFSETRILGVLQRIALCYFIGAILVYYLNKRQLVITSGLILVGYWIVMSAFGDYSLENNAVRTLDRWLFGDSHLYMGDGIPFDPEGLLSTFPAVVNVLGGYLAGIYIIEGNKVNYEKLAKLLLAGAGLLILSYWWNLGFPVNKKLWTSSFVTLTVGIDLVVLSMLIYATEFVKKPVNFHFFEIFGKNPLSIYLLSEYLAIFLFFFRVGDQSLYRFIYEKGFQWIGPYWGALAFAVAFMLICWLVGWWMDRRKIYIRV
ncbi:MAG: DUF1624 domain-containing protein [Lewinellaceae bacterium]|nr:DUF1624 domain-containing protein [Lewinella sp.]MCB9279230.1 DUF1624 domain-containing protein [Lewinellaceae bacterium]